MGKAKELTREDCRSIRIELEPRCTFDPQRDGEQILHMTMEGANIESGEGKQKKRVGFIRPTLDSGVQIGFDLDDEKLEIWHVRGVDLWNAVCKAVRPELAVEVGQ